MSSGASVQGAESALQTSRRTAERRPNGLETRARLLESARHLADTRSVPEFNVEDVTSGAEVSRAAFYMYFDNKVAICEEVARTSQAAFLETATDFSRDGGIRIVIERGVRAYVDSFLDDRPGMRMIYELAYADSEVRTEVREMRATMYSLWEVEFNAAVSAGECEPFDVAMVSRLLVGMLETFCVRTTRTEEYSGAAATADPVATIAELWSRALPLLG